MTELIDNFYNNFVYFNCFDGSKIIVRVTGFSDGVAYGDSENGSHWCNIEKVEPIPISQEIIQKNDFFVPYKQFFPYPYYEYESKEDNLKIGFGFPQGDKTAYKEPFIYIDSENVFIEHLPCKYVHQLQQILKLCQIEKEIVI